MDIMVQDFPLLPFFVSFLATHIPMHHIRSLGVNTFFNARFARLSESGFTGEMDLVKEFLLELFCS